MARIDIRKASILKFGLRRGFGATVWNICPACWNAMQVTYWEDGSIEEECTACLSICSEVSG